ncbi:hypothetical protein F4604DRAFT_1764987 [Suillus subluteus]|nr:hypothetical protein F4604DRAFT_1808156 [Suillus subluteus]KAG1874473.1 hypothetical protein F4604DRAFT_1764987 [Suillus subluteus]
MSLWLGLGQSFVRTASLLCRCLIHRDFVDTSNKNPTASRALSPFCTFLLADVRTRIKKPLRRCQTRLSIASVKPQVHFPPSCHFPRPGVKIDTMSDNAIFSNFF